MTIRAQRHGAIVNHGSTIFNLWAPDATSVAIILHGQEPVEMPRQNDGWYSIHLPCHAETEYAFLIDGRWQVPDPASHAQTTDVHGYSIVVDHSRYAWRSQNWLGQPWHHTILYELHVGLLGGFCGVEKLLPTLVAMGITAIQLMPLHQFPGERNWGYDGALLFAPAKAYGTPDELKHLIDTAHELGLMVFVDVVYNHFGPDGNYLHRYASAFFRKGDKNRWGDAIDFCRTEVRDFFYENALMWVLDYRVDGLRIDAAHAIAENHFLVELAQKIRAAVPPQRHVHLTLENEDNCVYLLEQGYNAQWNDDAHNILHHLLTHEEEGYYADFSQNPMEKLCRFLQEGFIYQGQENRHGKKRGEPSGHLPPTSFIVFLQNHDQIGNRAFGERLSLLANRDALKTAIALVLLSPMIPLLFMGEEWGCEQPFFYFTDHPPELAAAVRDGRRNEFADFSHFVDEAIRARIPDPNALTTFTDCVLHHHTCQQPLQLEWQDFYRQLLTLRHVDIIPRLIGAHSIGANILANGAICARWRMGDGSVLNMDVNLSSSAVTHKETTDHQRIIFRHRVDDHHQEEKILPPYSILVSLRSSYDP